MKRHGLVLPYLLLAIASAAASDWRQDRAMFDSLGNVHPRMRPRWLSQRGIDAGDMFEPKAPDSSGLRLVGKWGRGPSVEVTGQDTLVALSLGSELALLSLADPDRPRVLSEIQLNSMAGEAQLAGSRLYISSGGSFEVWDITAPASPVRLGQLPYGIGGFEVIDTLLYFIRQDTFKVFSVADPASPYQLGAYRDSGYFLCATTATAVLGHPDHGLYFVDINNPRSPHRAGSFPTDLPRSAEARGTLCCATVESRVEPYPIRFLTVDIGNPASPSQLGSLANAGGYDLCLDGGYAFASGRDLLNESFHIISVADSAHPTRVGQCQMSQMYNWAVWADIAAGRAYVANDIDGVVIVDIGNPSSPVRDTSMLGASFAVDIDVRGSRCYVADLDGGLKVLDVSDPTLPLQVGELDTLGIVEACYSVVADDSFAYMGWFNAPLFHVADVTDPTRPTLAGTCWSFNYAEDIVLRDTLAFCAEDNRFEVINVADPTNPSVVGSCGLPERSDELLLVDTIAYVANLTSLQVLSVANPANPRVVGSWDHYTFGIDVKDSVLYAASYLNADMDMLVSLSLADPVAPRQLDSVAVPRILHDVVLVDSLAYLGGYRCGLMVVDVADPANMRLLPTRWNPPSWISRLAYSPPYLYACCSDGGVAIFESLQVGIAEERVSEVRLAAGARPTVTAGRVHVGVGLSGPAGRVEVWSADGRLVHTGRYPLSAEMDLSHHPAGVYTVVVRAPGYSEVTRIVKTGGR